MNKIYMDQQYFIKNYFPDFTSLQEGDRADFIIWDYVPPTPIHEENFLGHYVYAITERPVRSVAMEGKFLMKDFKINVADEDKLNREIYLQGEKLYKSFENEED
jgi:cytosine/adenosine deaminase-related metal-dependent hydrolase